MQAIIHKKQKTAKNSLKTHYNAKQQKTTTAKKNSKNKVDNFIKFVLVFVVFMR